MKAQFSDADCEGKVRQKIGGDPESPWKIEYVFIAPKYDEDGNVIPQKPSSGVREEAKARGQ